MPIDLNTQEEERHVNRNESHSVQRHDGRLGANTPPIVSPQDWMAAREQMLVKEKALTRARRARCRTATDAMDGRRQGVCI
jgi:hypothetical protein